MRDGGAKGEKKNLKGPRAQCRVQHGVQYHHPDIMT